MKIRLPFGLSIRMIGLVLIALLPVMGIIFSTAWEQRRIARIELQKGAMRLIRPASRDYERQIEATRQLLTVLGRVPEVREGDPVRSSALFRDLLREYPIYLNIGLAGTDGRLIASALPVQGTVNLSDRPYFRRALQSRVFSIGQYQIGRISGKPSLNCGSPVFDSKGRLRAVVYAALGLDWLNQLAAQANLEPGSMLTLLDREGTILARYPHPEQWIGKSLAESPAMQAMLARKSGTIEATDEDGQVCFHAFTPLGGSELPAAFLDICTPASTTDYHANSLLTRNLLFLALVSLVSMLAAWAAGQWGLKQRIHALAEATEQLKDGNFNARTGLHHGNDELGQLALSFDEMAASLKAARKDLLQVQQEKGRFQREVIRAVTRGRFQLVDAGEIPNESHCILETELQSPEDYPRLRKEFRRVAEAAGMDIGAIRDLTLAMGEAASNTLKHAGDGECSIYLAGDRMVVRIQDHGQGIGADNLASKLLQPGFSTKISMGVGYTLMLELSDRLWLSTGPEGTIVQMEKWLHPDEHEDAQFAAESLKQL